MRFLNSSEPSSPGQAAVTCRRKLNPAAAGASARQ